MIYADDDLEQQETIDLTTPAFRRRATPIGEGMVESANQLALEALSQDSGMH